MEKCNGSGHGAHQVHEDLKLSLGPELLFLG